MEKEFFHFYDKLGNRWEIELRPRDFESPLYVARIEGIDGAEYMGYTIDEIFRELQSDQIV